MTITGGPGPDVCLRHGYTLAGIDQLARHAVRGHLERWSGGDRGDQVEEARFAILDHLYSSDVAPTRIELLQRAQKALIYLKNAEMREHGIPYHANITGASFAKFWYCAVDPGHEDDVVEAVALGQILPTLRTQHREALAALAATDDHTHAAALLGVGANTYTTWIYRGRTDFRALWHEHETPSRPWGRDRRAGSTASTRHQDGRANTAVARLRRRERLRSSP